MNIKLQASSALGQSEEVRPIRLSTVKNLPACFPLIDLTVGAIQGHIFKANDRFDSKGRKIKGNGLGGLGAVIRRGRKVLINVDKYEEWLCSGKGF